MKDDEAFTPAIVTTMEMQMDTTGRLGGDGAGQ